jgi:hypothetical protein
MQEFFKKIAKFGFAFTGLLLCLLFLFFCKLLGLSIKQNWFYIAVLAGKY